jgi:ferric-dicitrate binding protein FerR (iron transport regulator)
MCANHRITVFILACSLAASAISAEKIEPLLRTVDLDVGQTSQVTLHDGTKATVTLL